jgi:hypothetical protein
MKKLPVSLLISAAILVANSSAPVNASWEQKAGLLAAQLENGFDRRCLSTYGGEPRHIYVNLDGTLKIEPMNVVRQSPADEFYRDQSLWEIQPVNTSFAGTELVAGGGTICEASTFCQNCSELIHDKSDKYVYLHLVPNSAGGDTIRPWYQDHEKLVHASSNVVRLKVTKLGDPELANFRSDWVNFFLQQHGQVDDQAVQKQANVMRKKYSNLFG